MGSGGERRRAGPRRAAGPRGRRAAQRPGRRRILRQRLRLVPRAGRAPGRQGPAAHGDRQERRLHHEPDRDRQARQDAGLREHAGRRRPPGHHPLHPQPEARGREWLMGARQAAALAALLGAALVTSAAPADARPLEAIRQRGVISVCAPPNVLPAASKKGEPRGIQLDLAQAVADRLRVGLEVDWVTEAVMYRRVDCDLVMDAFVQVEALKELNLSPTTPYQHTGVALVLRPGLDGITRFDDLPKEARLAVRVGSAAQYLLGKRGLK